MGTTKVGQPGKRLGIPAKRTSSSPEGDRAAFVAECKIWHGAKKLVESLDQLVRYLTWRDCKAALVIFNMNTAGFAELLEEGAKRLERAPQLHQRPGGARRRRMAVRSQGPVRTRNGKSPSTSFCSTCMLRRRRAQSGKGITVRRRSRTLGKRRRHVVRRLLLPTQPPPLLGVWVGHSREEFEKGWSG